MLTDFAPWLAPDLDPLSWFDETFATDPAGTISVSTSFGIAAEATGVTILARTMPDEAVASLAPTSTLLTEASASATLATTMREESLAGLPVTAAVIAEALTTPVAANTVRQEAAGAVATDLAPTPPVQIEAKATATTAPVLASESLQQLLPVSVVAEELLASAALTSVERNESLASAALTPAPAYEARGIVTTPVSQTLTVQLEASTPLVAGVAVDAELEALPIFTGILEAIPALRADVDAMGAFTASIDIEPEPE